MKVKEVIERECCNKSKDMVEVRAQLTQRPRKIFTCKHCGQLWTECKEECGSHLSIGYCFVLKKMKIDTFTTY